MTALESGLLVVVVLLTVVVVALVRAQAATARRLAVVERRLLRAQRREERVDESPTTRPEEHPVDHAAPTPPQGDLVDVRGVTVAGEPTAYELETPATPTLVAFLSTTCGICLSLWERLRDEGVEGVPAVVVTKDPAVEELDIAQSLAGSGSLPVVMSSEAWDDYEVPGSPYFLLVGGEPATVLAEGDASSWDALRNLAQQSVHSVG
jgi:hypothetical protein